MIVSDEERLIFMHIPKTAGIFIRRNLPDDRRFAGIRMLDGVGMRDFAHLPLRLVAEHFPTDFAKMADYRSFAAIREPHARFVSSVQEHLKQFKGIPKEQVTSPLVIDTAREIVKHLPSDEPEYAHFLPQIQFVELDGRRIVTDLFDFANIDDMVHEIEAYTGRQMDREPKNVAGAAIHPAIHRGWRKVRDAAPWLTPFGRSRIVRKFFTRRNEVTLTDDLSAFVDAYYRADIALYQKVARRTERTATC